MASKPIQQSTPSVKLAFDFHLLDGGSIFILTPLNDWAVAWIEEHVGRESGYHPDYPTLVIEPRYLSALVDGIFDDGLDIATGVRR